MRDTPALFWGLVASMWVGNLMLVVLNLPLIGIWVRLLTIPYRLLFPAVLLFACIGVYSVHSNAMEILLLALFGLMGYILAKVDCDPAPLLLGFVLGPMMEENFRRALLLAHGDLLVFMKRPISGACMTIAFLLVALVAYRYLTRSRASAPGARPAPPGAAAPEAARRPGT